MTEWAIARLGEKVEILNRKRIPLSRIERATRQGRYRYFGAQGVIDHVDGFLFDGEFVLVAEDGENLRSRKQPVAALVSGQFWVNNHAHVLRAREGVANNRFLLHAINHAALDGLITGAAQPKLTKANLEQLKFSCPSPAKQDRIAALLGAFDELIEINERRIELLEELARSLYREWFVRFRFPGHDEAAFVDSDLGPKPHGWATRSLFDVADVGFGYSFKSDGFSDSGRFPVVRIRDVPSGVTPTFTDESAQPRYAVHDGDVLIGMDGEFHLSQWSGGDAWLNQRVARLRPMTGLSARHLMLAVAAPIRAWNEAITGTTVAHLGKRHLETIQVVVPPVELLREVTTAFDAFAEELLLLANLNRRLAAIRDLLLPRLVTCRLDISDVDLGDLLSADAA